MKKMDPLTLQLITSFTLKLVNEFKHRNDVPTEAEITARWQADYAAAMTKNKKLQDETK